MFRSIQWKMVLIFLLLILMAMELIGVYLLQSLDNYYIEEFSTSLRVQAQILGGFLSTYLSGTTRQEDLDRFVEDFSISAGVDVYVLDANGIVLSSPVEKRDKMGERILQPEVNIALGGNAAEFIRTNEETGEEFLYLAIPITSSTQQLGVVYVVASLSPIKKTIADIRAILLSAGALALGITVVLALILARTITGPIREITSKASKMAAGDFEHQIKVRSNDEIGQLASMFNYLTQQLELTMGEITQEKNKLEAILTHMADGLIALDRDGKIIALNPAAADFFGVQQEQILEQPLTRLRTAVNWQEIVDTVTEQGEVMRLITLDEPKHMVLRAYFAPLKTVEDSLYGVVVVLQDVTEEQKLDNLRREFVANVSHELRTPITTVKNYVETLQDGVDNPELEKVFLGVIASETDRMARLVTDLLQLSQMDYDKARWDWAPLHLGELLEDIHLRLEPHLQQKKLTFAIQVQPDLSQIIADSDRIGQVLVNVLSNAIKYTSEGGRISVQVDEKTYTNTNGVEIKVKDTGIGIPEEDIARIFERFYRVDKARSREMGGTGLGLSIAHQIILAHGGRIDIESEVDRGTVVSIFLPNEPPAYKAQAEELA